MRVAVTGASGHVGANLVRELIAQGVEVRALVHDDTRGVDGLPLEQVKGSVTDPAAVERLVDGCERVYHLAAMISIDPADRQRLMDVNLGGAKTVVAACKKAGVQRFVHVSSIHAYQSEPTSQTITEERALASGPDLPGYDASKSAAEQHVRDQIAAGLDGVIVNPTAILGPNDFRPSHMGEVLLDLYHGKLPGIVVGSFDWVDVREVTSGILAAADRAPRGSRYLLGGNRATVQELSILVERLTGKPRPKLVAPMWLARAVAPAAVLAARAVGKRPLFTPSSLFALRNHLDVSHARAERELGYRARPLEETVRDAFAWFGANGMLKS